MKSFFQQWQRGTFGALVGFFIAYERFDIFGSQSADRVDHRAATRCIMGSFAYAGRAGRII